jgi:hypothetical protein
VDPGAVAQRQKSGFKNLLRNQSILVLQRQTRGV